MDFWAHGDMALTLELLITVPVFLPIFQLKRPYQNDHDFSQIDFLLYFYHFNNIKLSYLASQWEGSIFKYLLYGYQIL